jgi:hypothetical protein
VRDRLRFHRDELEQPGEAKVTAISIFDSGAAVRRTGHKPLERKEYLLRIARRRAAPVG